MTNLKIKKVLLLGSGALKIGQAGEFDYSGSQAIKALKEESIEVILINPNIATIQTSEGFATRVYFLPLEPYFVEEVIRKEKPNGILLSFGGQTALNCGLALAKNGTLAKYQVRVLGTPIPAIEKTEDRQLFADSLIRIGLLVPTSKAVRNLAGARKVAQSIGYPLMVRSGFSLGGQDSGVARGWQELSEIAKKALAKSPQILIEKYLGGWKEVEYEVVRDSFDNCIAVCNMENIDPMGIHTGESIVVAPSQTLNNFEYHSLREVAIKVIRHLGIVGECNIQFALNPRPLAAESANNSPINQLDYRIIEVNARLSRSSALASKATGYPLAYVAAKLALGYSLTELKNAVTQKTIACFEPALDYLALKIPRWDLGKFIKSENQIGSSMQSVGEVMALGRKFEEALQKAVRMLDIGFEGILDEKAPGLVYSKPTPWRLFAIAKSVKGGTSVAKIHKKTGIDPFFIEKIKNLVQMEEKIKKTGQNLTTELLRGAKEYGFSDARIAKLIKSKEETVTKKREAWGIVPSVKQIDTLAAEYPAETNYLYLTYNGEGDDIDNRKSKVKVESQSQIKNQKDFSLHTLTPHSNDRKVIVLGSGPYRIGSSVEFDWCCVTCAQTISQNGFASIIINCNPETVSTDYDMAQKLYFEELTAETVMEIYKKERASCVIISMGGQTPNNLATKLEAAGAKILGTSTKSIDTAEDRSKFSRLCDELKIAQPIWAKFENIDEAVGFAEKIKYPVLIRPSYVLSGTAMNVAFTSKDLREYLELASKVSREYPVVISKFHQDAKELEIDAVAERGNIICSTITEHVENAGVHSGDSTVLLPPQKLYLATVKQAETIAQKIAKALQISGPFNIQFLATDNNILVIECNLRASRSFPFVSKVTGVNFAKIATEAILGKKIKPVAANNISYVGVKSPQFSFSRIKGADPILRVEMASTGEVACFGHDVYEAFLKSLIASGVSLPQKSVFVSLAGEENKVKFLEAARTLSNIGLKIYATEGTSKFLRGHLIEANKLHKIHENKKPNILSYLNDKKIDLVINIFDPYFKKEFDDDYLIRRATIDFGIPLLTNLQTAELFVKALAKKQLADLKTLPWDAYVTPQN